MRCPSERHNQLVTHGSGKLWRLTGHNLEAANKVGQPPGVTLRQAGVSGLSGHLTAAPISTTIYEFPVASVAQ